MTFERKEILNARARARAHKTRIEHQDAGSGTRAAMEHALAVRLEQGRGFGPFGAASEALRISASFDEEVLSTVRLLATLRSPGKSAELLLRASFPTAALRGAQPVALLGRNAGLGGVRGASAPRHLHWDRPAEADGCAPRRACLGV